MLLALIHLVALHGGNPHSFLDRAEFDSASGAWHLTVSAESRYGLDGAQYDLLRNGEPMWSGHLPFALREVSISDDGLMAGHAEQRVSKDRVDFLVAAVSANGEVLFTVRDKIVRSLFVGVGTIPHARGQIADFDHGIFTVRLDGELGLGNPLVWRRYSLPGGERLEDLVPSDRLEESLLHRPYEREAHHLPGTDLTLVAWSERSRDVVEGAAKDLVTLVNREGEIVWILGRPEPAVPEGVALESWELAYREAGWEGMIVDTMDGGVFDIWHFDEGQRVTYRATGTPGEEGKWFVEELARSPKPIPIPALRESVQLELLDKVQLDVQSNHIVPALLDDVRAWTFGVDGGFELMRVPAKGPIELLRVDSKGVLIDTVEMDSKGINKRARSGVWAPMGDGMWLVYSHEFGLGPNSAFRADGRTGELSMLKELKAIGEALKIARGVRLPSGGLVLLAQETGRDDHLLIYGPTGDLVFRKSADSWSKSGSWILGIHDIAVTDRGEIVLLENNGDSIVVLSATGEELRRFDLSEVLGTELNYPTGLLHAVGDRVLVEDFNALPSFWEVELDGSGGRPFEPRWPGKEPSRKLAKQALYAPDGTLWSSDDYCIVRLDENGVVVERVGPLATSEAMHEPGLTSLLRDGRICVRDRRTGAVHVWNEGGDKLFTGQVDDGDGENVAYFGGLVGGPDGQVWSQARRGGFGFSNEDNPLGYLGWNEEGGRLGYHDFGGSVAFAPDGENHWVWGEEPGARLHDSACSELAVVEMHPNGRWIRSVEGVACDSDGTVWIVDSPQGARLGDRYLLRSDSKGIVHNVTSMEGSGIFSGATFPRSDWLREGSLSAAKLDSNGVIVGRCEFVLEEEGGVIPLGITPDGERFLVIDTESLILYRYDLTGIELK